ncbi:MAG: polyphenol oxidase family protein [Thermoanaerobaculia bacterium]
MTSSWTVEDSPFGRIVVANSRPPATALFYTTADDSGRLGEDVVDRLREWIGERFGISIDRFGTCSQIHGTGIQPVTAADSAWCETEGCDALWTAEPKAGLGIKVADCLPVALVDPDAFVIADIHSGWRGTVKKITERTVSRLREESGFEAARAHAYLGPSIRRCCFEVGEEVVDTFIATFGELAWPHIDRSFGPRPHLDLAALTRDILLQLGLRSETIHDSELCTRCDGSLFHSYRRSGPGSGRNLAIVAH